MSKIILVLMSLLVLVNEALAYDLNALQQNALNTMQTTAPQSIVKNYNPNPKETGLRPGEGSDGLEKMAIERLRAEQEAKAIYDKAKPFDKNVDDNQDKKSLETEAQLKALEDKTPQCHGVGCTDNTNEASVDLKEGIARLGAMIGSAQEVSSQQLSEKKSGVFSGSNLTCREASEVGNCCGGHARFLNCRQEEKDLRQAINDGRAIYLGTFCAHRKYRHCWEHKQSWCVFNSKLAYIIQVQGRSSQLGISFGWAADNDNYPNCRGLSPLELERLDFSKMDLKPIEDELISKKRLPEGSNLSSKTVEKAALEIQGKENSL